MQPKTGDGSMSSWRPRGAPAAIAIPRCVPIMGCDTFAQSSGGGRLGDSEEIKARLAKWTRPEPKFKKGYLALYSRLAESADKGAIIRNKF